MHAVAHQVTSSVPSFDSVVAAVLQVIGVPPVLISVLLLAFALESWYSNGERMVHAATIVGDAVARGSNRLVAQRPVRIFVTVITTITVAMMQVIMVRVSYVGGSIVATPFDPVRWNALQAAYGVSPLRFVDPKFLAQFLAVDTISVAYVLVAIVLMLISYRSNAPIRVLWLVATFPYWLLLFGSAAIATLSLIVDVSFFLLYLLGGISYDWRFIRDYVLDAPHLTVDIVSGIYCLTALAAIGGSAVVRRMWTAASSA
jgi:magnesium-transporting ATPase (P-type)